MSLSAGCRSFRLVQKYAYLTVLTCGGYTSYMFQKLHIGAYEMCVIVIVIIYLSSLVFSHPRSES